MSCRRGLLPVLVAVLAGCGQAAATTTSAPAVVARVNGTDITETQVDLRLAATLASLSGAGAPTDDAAMTARLRSNIVRGLIFDTVIAQEAAFRQVAVSDAEVEAEFQRSVSDAGGHDGLETQLAAAGSSDAALRDDIRSRLNEQHLEDYYAKQRVTLIFGKLQSGTDFATAATTYSDSPDTASKAGALGTLSDDQTSQQLGAAVLTAVKALPAGGYTPAPVRTASGYEIVRVEAIAPAGRTLREILVAAPDPYTVRERPQWFAAQIFQAILDDCKGRKITVFTGDAGADPCAAGTPSASPKPPASPTP
jgi:parvulin-like peptidyl-prolyl isomerase